MGTVEQQPTGPNLKKGVPLETLKVSQKIQGHVDDTPVLLIHHHDQVYAVSALCTHYSGPLKDGIVVDGTVRCPWHHACFDLKTGEALKAPALNPLTTWQTEIKDGMIYVREQRPKGEPRALPGSQEHLVIIGSGAAGHAAAEMLRREGFQGALTILTQDSELPYDRPNLSKDYLAGQAPAEWIPLRPPEFYQSQKIEIRLNSKVTGLDTKQKRISLSNGESLAFTKCLLAMGGSPIKPPIEGLESANVYFLRSFSDCKAILKALDGKKKVVIIGAGFIGLEAAAAFKTRGLDVTIVAPQDLPLSHVVGKEVGALLKSVHEKHGVRFLLKQTVQKVENQGVVLGDGRFEQADLILVATGIKTNTEIAQQAGIETDNGILVNEFFQTNAEDIFAAGDLAQWKDSVSGHAVRVEHWVVAQRQGQMAAQNMLGQKLPYRDIPFFWSQQFEVMISYVGHAKTSTQTTVYGSPENLDCAVAFFEDNRITAVLTIGRDQLSLQIEEAMKKRDFSLIQSLLESSKSATAQS